MCTTKHLSNWRMAAGAAMILAGCWGGNEDDADGGADDVTIGTRATPFDPAAFRVEGRVEIGTSPAVDVLITGRCGDHTVETWTDKDGEYAFEADVTACDVLAVEFDKESYLPTMRNVHLPLKTSPIRLDIELEELLELQCGSIKCTTRNSEIGADPIAQGWTVMLTGPGELEFFPGEFRDTNGNLLSLLGFSYNLFKDVDGRRLDSMPAHDLCHEISKESLDWLGDVDLSTERVEMRYYELDPQTGRWRPAEAPAQASYILGDRYEKDADGKCEYVLDENGRRLPNYVPLKRDELGDVRAETHYVENPCSTSDPPALRRVSQYRVCFPVAGSGFYAWGIEIPHRTCFAATLEDECGRPLKGARFSLTGRDHGFRALGWTDADGRACLEAVPSEPETEDFDADGLGGETFWVDVELAPLKGARLTIPDYETQLYPAGDNGCAAPDECVQLRQTIDTRQSCDDPE